MTKRIERSLILIACLLGMTGVMAAAASSHSASELLGPYAQIALTHAPVLLILGLLPNISRAQSVAGMVLGLGAVIFCMDLATRNFVGTRLFPMSAPIGGSLVILGWLSIALASLIKK